MAKYSVSRRVFFMVSVIHLHPLFYAVAGRPIAVPFFSSIPRACLNCHKLPLSAAAVRSKTCASVGEGDDSIKIAANLVALLGSQEEARSVNPNLARELLACLRFLVPHPVPFLGPVIGQRFESRKGDTPDDNWQAFESRDGEFFDENAEFPQTPRSSFGVRKRRVAVQDERVKKLIWWPPAAVMKLARSAVERGGDPSVIGQALDPRRRQVPDVEDSKKHECQLTRTRFGRRFVNKVSCQRIPSLR